MICLYLKILHISHNGLPDWRVEKTGITGKKNGYNLFFGGPKSEYKNDIFTKIYNIEWTPAANYGLPFYWYKLKRKIHEIIEDVRPDIIHAHNIISAKAASEFNIPLVYDDHEYWSVYALLSKEQRIMSHKNIVRNFLTTKMNDFRKRRCLKMWTKWEEEVVSSHPTLTVSNLIVKDLKNKYLNYDIFLLPNFPLKIETLDFINPIPHENFSGVYAGIDRKYLRQSHRNMDGLEKIFDDNNIGELNIIGRKDKNSSKVKYHGFMANMFNVQ